MEVEKQKPASISNFSQRRFRDCRRSTRTIISTQLRATTNGNKKEDIDDVSRLMMLFLMASFFVTNKSLTLSWGYIKYVEDLDKIKTYNWSKHIFEYLISSLCKNEDPIDVTGCVMVLAYWLLEKLKVCKPLKKNAELKCIKWDLRDLTCILKSTTVHELAKRKVVEEVDEDEESNKSEKSTEDEESDGDGESDKVDTETKDTTEKEESDDNRIEDNISTEDNKNEESEEDNVNEVEHRGFEEDDDSWLHLALSRLAEIAIKDSSEKKAITSSSRLRDELHNSREKERILQAALDESVSQNEMY